MTSQLDRRRRHVETRAAPLARQIERWLRQYARVFVEDELRRMGSLASKAAPSKYQKLLDNLEKLILRYGIRQAVSAAGATSQVGEQILATGVMLDFFEGKESLIQGIADETEAGVRAQVQAVIQESLREEVRPSTGEIARRIRESFEAGDSQFQDFALSPERAALIARTEMVQAENSGIYAGYELTGVEEIRWLAYSDGRSGDRHHEKMHNKTTKVGEPFVTPLGNRLLYPGDPAAPIRETANCRCTVAPVRRKR